MIVREDKTYSFKMNSGEEIIGKVKVITDSEYILDSPLTVAMTPQGTQLMPAMFTIDLESEVNVNRSSIAMTSECRQDVADAYRESVTGIKVPDKQIILG